MYKWINGLGKRGLGLTIVYDLTINCDLNS
jgi:hypothetical protein